MGATAKPRRHNVLQQREWFIGGVGCYCWQVVVTAAGLVSICRYAREVLVKAGVARDGR